MKPDAIVLRQGRPSPSTDRPGEPISFTIGTLYGEPGWMPGPFPISDARHSPDQSILKAL